MKYGETYAKEACTFIYKKAYWNGYYTNDEGDGLWHAGKWIEGADDFSVRNCSNEKNAKTKIRKFVEKIEKNHGNDEQQ